MLLFTKNEKVPPGEDGTFFVLCVMKTYGPGTGGHPVRPEKGKQTACQPAGTGTAIAVKKTVLH